MNSHEPPTESIMRPRVMGFILSIASGLIISTNLLVAAALLKLLLKKRSQSWVFVLNLALADALLAGKGTAVGSLLALWISSLTLGFLPVMVRQLQTKDYGGFCAFFSVINHMGIIMLFSACFFPVLSVFVYIYLDILKIACSHQKQICQVRQAGSRTGDRQDYENQPHQQLRSHYWSHVKALRTVGVLVGCFLVLWCPSLWRASCQLKGVLENYLWLLGLSNSLINPLVYAFWQREVRLQLASLCSCFRALAARPPCFTERCDPQPPVLNQAGAPAGENLNPSLLRAISVVVGADKQDVLWLQVCVRQLVSMQDYGSEDLEGHVSDLLHVERQEVVLSEELEGAEAEQLEHDADVTFVLEPIRLFSSIINVVPRKSRLKLATGLFLRLEFRVDA
ncbi:hypothetical protein F7725_006442 [Dissostichus mawsoni]|uniref:G-protein coupled receptors family 1 profile domain-containing protein n=1 Tax=Dissostichus mawsoni TaxID=36200 RepID=A0A7J5XTY0_DISMA|nr:hypothetical protein F7725_006442 [Dissostichus mawsoni]